MIISGRRKLLEPVRDVEVGRAVVEVLQDMVETGLHLPGGRLDWRTLKVDVSQERFYGSTYLVDVWVSMRTQP